MPWVELPGSSTVDKTTYAQSIVPASSCQTACCALVVRGDPGDISAKRRGLVQTSACTPCFEPHSDHSFAFVSSPLPPTRGYTATSSDSAALFPRVGVTLQVGKHAMPNQSSARSWSRCFKVCLMVPASHAADAPSPCTTGEEAPTSPCAPPPASPQIPRGVSPPIEEMRDLPCLASIPSQGYW
jgi:hypothetical protein